MEKIKRPVLGLIVKITFFKIPHPTLKKFTMTSRVNWMYKCTGCCTISTKMCDVSNLVYLCFPVTQLYKFACQFVQNSLKNNSNHSLLKFTHLLLHKLVKRKNFKYNIKLLENRNIKPISAILSLNTI